MGRSTSWEEQRPVASSHEMHAVSLPMCLPGCFGLLLVLFRNQHVYVTEVTCCSVAGHKEDTQIGMRQAD